MKRHPASAISISKELNDLLQTLGPNHKFSKWIEDMKNVLKEHVFSGEQVKKNQIPKYYIDKHGVNNLYRYRHPEGYRSCYTVVKGYTPRILDILSHPEYEKNFGYKTT
jgi:hypothetical protein